MDNWALLFCLSPLEHFPFVASLNPVFSQISAERNQQLPQQLMSPPTSLGDQSDRSSKGNSHFSIDRHVRSQSEKTQRLIAANHLRPRIPLTQSRLRRQRSSQSAPTNKSAKYFIKTIKQRPIGLKFKAIKQIAENIFIFDFKQFKKNRKIK